MGVSRPFVASCTPHRSHKSNQITIPLETPSECPRKTILNPPEIPPEMSTRSTINPMIHVLEIATKPPFLSASLHQAMPGRCRQGESRAVAQAGFRTWADLGWVETHLFVFFGMGLSTN